MSANISAQRFDRAALAPWIVLPRTYPEWVSRRAGGRRGFNAQRQFAARMRRQRVAEMIGRLGWVWGAQAAIARELGVNRSTISRDLERLEEELGTPMRIQIGRLNVR